MKNTFHIISVLPPKADAFAGTVTTNAVDLSNYNHAAFIITTGIGDTGTSTITVEALSDEVGTEAIPIEFRYKEALSGDNFSDYILADTSGFTTTVGENKTYIIEVDDRSLAKLEYKFVRIKAVEVVDAPVEGSIVAILTGARYSD
ncbi:hypothetical protein [Caloranaerobacter ferrireducens]|uniref:hypothetical protein n=1 Tax=Caloranaerobacter ferrireducens TaxID=1323370 RepID=UPI00084D90A5|nr:hypothetical protein [Caloranaerobacter ferrireducens]